MAQDRDFVNSFCATLPGAQPATPFGEGHDSWIIGGKMFALIGLQTPGVCVKCADIETARLLIEMDRAERAPYFHRSWVLVPWDRVEDAEFQDRLMTSYTIIRAGLSRKLQATLPPMNPGTRSG